MRVRASLTISIAFLSVACGPAATSSTPTSTPAAASHAATPVPYVADIAVDGDRTLHIVCSGPTDTGRATVVFENGSGPSFQTWSGVVDEIEATDRSCAYDRAGIGGSDPAPEPWTTQDQVDDLATLLEAAGVSGPIVLVAHSLGGWNAILYTAEHPEQVVGAVLVDVLPPGLDRRLLEELPPETADEPDEIREARGAFTGFLTDPSQNPEGLDIAGSEAQVRAAPGFGARPTEILWATDTQLKVWPGFDPALADRLNAAIDELLRDVEVLADDPTVTEVDAGHAIQEERPEVVVEAIRRVLDQVEP